MPSHQPQKTRIDFDFDHGGVEGILVHAGRVTEPLVVITNGHNGFYNYGMFPYIQERLAESGISSYSYNFSHGGVENGDDHFTNLEAYRQNCMRLETLDLKNVLENLPDTQVGDNGRRPFLLSHSLGSVPTLFAARDAIKEGVTIRGLVLLAPIKTLKVFPDDMMTQWKDEGVYYLKNNRTGQLLPQGPEFLEEILQAEKAWNVEEAAKATPTDYLLVHGRNDSDVPLDHSESLASWARDVGYNVELKVIAGAGHTFNTSHPFEGPSDELKELLETVSGWIHQHAG